MNEQVGIAMLALLRRLEWSGQSDLGEGITVRVCPVCGGTPPYDSGRPEEGEEHTPECELNGLIEALQRAKE